MGFKFSATFQSHLYFKAGDETQLTSFHFISSWKLTTILTCLPPSFLAEPSPVSSNSMSVNRKHRQLHSCILITTKTILVYASTFIVVKLNTVGLHTPRGKTPEPGVLTFLPNIIITLKKWRSLKIISQLLCIFLPTIYPLANLHH